jgi:hypothetical protein
MQWPPRLVATAEQRVNRPMFRGSANDRKRRNLATGPGIGEGPLATQAVGNVFAADRGSRLRQPECVSGRQGDRGTQARMASISGPTPMIAITRLML